MNESPEVWLERLFEFSYCEECGGDAEDHEVCLVPGIGTYFARCLGTVESELPEQISPERGKDHERHEWQRRRH